MPLEAEQVFNALVDIKPYCLNNKIETFSTMKVEGPTSLTNYVRIRTMFRYVFKSSNITIKIYKEQNYGRGATTNNLRAS